MTDTNATTPAEPQEVAYNTTEDAAQALLARWNGRADEPTAEADESEAPEVDEQQDTVAEQPDEGTAEAAKDVEAQSEELEIDVAGEKFKLPKALTEQAQRIQQKVKDLEAGTTRKFQEAAEIRKAVEAEREQVQRLGQLASQHTDLIADLRATQREIEALNRMDWNALSDSDPVGAQKQMARLMQLQNVQQHIGGQLQQAVQAMNATQQQLQQQRAAQGNERLSKLIPNLSDATKQELSQYIAQRDLTPEGKEALWDPEVVAAFHDAKRYRELMAQKPVAKKPEKPAPTLRPGSAAAPTTNAKARVDQLKSRAYKTGATEDIAAALLARANLRK